MDVCRNEGGRRIGRGTRWLALLVTLVMAWSAAPADAGTASGDIDQLFGPDGTGFDDLGTASLTGDSALHAIAAQGSARIVAGTRGVGIQNSDPEVFVARLSADGTLDPSFGTNGVTAIPGSTQGYDCLAVDGSGAIYVAGYLADGDVVRLDPDGTLDTSFGTNGFADADALVGAKSVALTADGDLVVVGYAIGKRSAQVWGAVRFASDGSADGSFGKRGLWKSGYAMGGVLSLGIDGQGRILIAGATSISDPDQIVRLTADGDLDTSFGLASAASASASAKKGGGNGNGGGGNGGGGGGNGGGSDGGVVVPGFSVASLVIRDLEIGASDDFYISGTVNLGTAASPDREPFLAHFDADGVLDTTFGDGAGNLAGLAYPELSGEQGGFSVLLAGGRLTQAGYSDDGSGENMRVYRYDLDGSMDAGFGTDGASEDVDHGFDEKALALARDDAGEILVVGFAFGTGQSPYNYALVARYFW